MIVVTDADYKNIKYIQSGLWRAVTKLGGQIELASPSHRFILDINVDQATLKYVKSMTLDKVADVVAISYKYDFLKSKLRTRGLGDLEYELLLCALISADLDDDKRYVKQKLASSTHLCIDGAFNFTMKPLRAKWTEVIGYIPTYFINSELKEFISYLTQEKGGKRVFVDNGKVYDCHFNLLNRTKLITGFNGAEVLREVILSSCGEVELASKLQETEEYYLKEFFGDKIFFASTYFT